MPKPAENVPATAYAILGMLVSAGQMSGYDLGKAVAGSIGYFFSPAKSHIYAELRRLVASGFATEKSVRQQDRPDKRVYRATAKGERALRAWLEGPETEPEIFKSPFVLKVFFGAAMDPAILAEKVKAYRDEARQRLGEFRAIEEQIAKMPEARFPYLTLKAGLAHTRATVRWCDDVLSELEGS